MLYKISSDGQLKISLNESSRAKSILQNIALLLRTRQGTVPYYREFGLPMNFLDRPLSIAIPIAVMETREAISRFEPCAEFVSANLTGNAVGILIVEAEVNISDEQESGI